MIQNPITFVISNNGTILDAQRGTIRALSNYASKIYVVAPFESVSLRVNYLIYDIKREVIGQYLAPTSLKGKDVLSPNDTQFQTAGEWQVWEVSISQRALHRIAKYRAGRVGVSFQVNTIGTPSQIVLNTGYKGIITETTQLDDPQDYEGNVGDYYVVDRYNIGTEFVTGLLTKGDYVYFTGTQWLKGQNIKQVAMTTTTDLAVDPSLLAELPQLPSDATETEELIELIDELIGDVADLTTLVGDHIDDLNDPHDTQANQVETTGFGAVTSNVQDDLDALDTRIDDIEAGDTDITYDPTADDIIDATTVAGAIGQLDSALFTHLQDQDDPHNTQASQVNTTSNISVQTALDNKTDIGHTHSISDVTGLQTSLDSKIPLSQKGAANGVATLDGNSKLPESQLPSFVFGGMRLIGTIGTNRTAQSLYDDALFHISTNGGSLTGCYFLVSGGPNTSVVVTGGNDTVNGVSHTFSFGPVNQVGEEDDNLFEDGVTLESGDWIVIGRTWNFMSTTFQQWGIVNNTYGKATSTESGIVKLGYTSNGKNEKVDTTVDGLFVNLEDYYDIDETDDLIKVAKQIQYYPNTRNDSGSTIFKGDVVQFAGSQGDFIKIKKAVASEINANPEALMGLAESDILNNQFGNVVWFGQIKNFNTGSLTLGQVLYFDTSSGNLTPTEPATNKIIVAAVEKVSSGGGSNGILLVRIKWVSRDIDEIDGLTDALAGKSAVGHTHTKSEITDFAHTHLKADITDFAHTHPISEVDGLQTELDGKVDITGDNITGDLNVSGNLGLGTTAPSFKLDVSSGDIRVQNGGNVASAGGSINFSAVVNALPMAQIKGLLGFSGSPSGILQNQGELAIYTRPVTGNNEALIERMRIDATGNVGIGTTVPASGSKLTIRDANIANARFENTVGGFLEVGATLNASSEGFIKYTNALRIFEGSTQRLTLVGSNVGIGTTNPTERLDVVGNIKASGNILFNGTDLQTQLNAINQDTNTTHTQTESIKTVPVGTLESTVDNFEADGLTLVNSVKNGDFSNGTTNWTTTSTSSFTVANNVASFTATATFGNITNVITPNTTINDVIFTVADVKSTSNQVRFDPNSTPLAVFHSGSNNFETLSVKFTAPSTAAYGPRVTDNRTTGFDQIQVKNVYWINMTALGIASYTEAQMLDLVRSGYFDGIANVEKPSVTAVGKNLAFNVDGWEQGVIGGAPSGANSPSSQGIRTIDYIAVKPNTTYNFSVKSPYEPLSFVQYDSNKEFVLRTVQSSAITSVAITTTSSTNYVRLVVSDGNNTTTPQMFDNIQPQLEQGSTATTYEPYKSSTLTIDTELRSLPNGVRDRVYEQNGEVWLEKRVDLDRNNVVKNATGWTQQFTLTNTVSFAKNFTTQLGYTIPTAINILSNTLLRIANQDIPNKTESSFATDEEASYINTNGTLSIKILKSKLSTVNSAGLEAYLQANNVEFQYQLATPQLINLTQEGKVDGELIAFENGTIYNTSDTFHADISFDVASNRSAQITGLLESASYQAKQIDTKANKVQEAWIEPTLLNGWVNFGAFGAYNLAYMKDEFGFVRIRGAIKSGTVTDGTAVFTLPVDYRPTSPVTLLANLSGNTRGIVEVATNGNFLIRVGNATLTSVIETSFKAGN